MWIPEFWYEKLPALYAGGALTSLGWLGWPALLSALLLLGASALILHERRQYRLARPHPAHRVRRRTARR